MFPTTVAGSLPKPSWLAEPNKLWAPWRLAGEELAAAKLDATLLAAEGAGGRRHRHRQRRRAVAPAFRARLSGVRRRHRLFPQGRDGHPRRPLQGDGAAGGRRPARSRGACTRAEARLARAHTRRKLKFTLPGPMTIVDTIADAHYGDRVTHGDGVRRAAQRGGARARGRRRRRHPVRRARLQRLHGRGERLGIAALHRAIEGLTLHHRRAYLLRLRHQGQHRLEGDARQRVAAVRGDLPGAGGEPHRPGLGRMPQLARADAASVAAERQGRAGRRDRRRDRSGRDRRRRSPRRSARRCSTCRRSASSPAPIAAWRRCAATSRSPSSRRSAGARNWRGSGLGDNPPLLAKGRDAADQ